MAAARWAKDRIARDAGEAERIAEIRKRAIVNLPRNAGDVLGVMQWTCAATGKVRRWVVRIGDRSDRITVESPGVTATQSHGWAWFFTKLRKAMRGAITPA
jgi:hypothetical protein